MVGQFPPQPLESTIFLYLNLDNSSKFPFSTKHDYNSDPCQCFLNEKPLVMQILRFNPSTPGPCTQLAKQTICVIHSRVLREAWQTDTGVRLGLGKSSSQQLPRALPFESRTFSCRIRKISLPRRLWTAGSWFYLKALWQRLIQS